MGNFRISGAGGGYTGVAANVGSGAEKKSGTGLAGGLTADGDGVEVSGDEVLPPVPKAKGAGPASYTHPALQFYGAEFFSTIPAWNRGQLAMGLLPSGTVNARTTDELRSNVVSFADMYNTCLQQKQVQWKDVYEKTKIASSDPSYAEFGAAYDDLDMTDYLVGGRIQRLNLKGVSEGKDKVNPEELAKWTADPLISDYLESVKKSSKDRQIQPQDIANAYILLREKKRDALEAAYAKLPDGVKVVEDPSNSGKKIELQEIAYLPETQDAIIGYWKDYKGYNDLAYILRLAEENPKVATLDGLVALANANLPQEAKIDVATWPPALQNFVDGQSLGPDSEHFHPCLNAVLLASTDFSPEQRRKAILASILPGLCQRMNDREPVDLSKLGTDAVGPTEEAQVAEDKAIICDFIRVFGFTDVKDADLYARLSAVQDAPEGALKQALSNL